VFDNIAHGLVGTPLEKAPKTEQMAHVVEAAKIAYADDFISQLPNGYDTDIGQRGGLLSGGQKQRIAIARSLVSDPKVLLLDEATSALDPYAEGIVQQALDRASAGRTTIVIAHKLATIRKADNIVVMSKGKIIEQGTHENLISQNGAYARLVTIQQLTVAAEDSVEDSDVETLSVEDETKVIHGKEQLTRCETLEQATTDSEPEKDRYDDEGYRQLGLPTVVWRLVVENPDLKWAYLALVSGCVVSCE
jgi:ATP-binding cassette subfamily B (MDR/TAP) protein 1